MIGALSTRSEAELITKFISRLTVAELQRLFVLN